MSGFVAIINLDGAPVDEHWLQSATTSMAFRGPDAQQTWHQGSVGLGHTLLRTTFESASEQQPCTLDGQVWLVADARIDDRARLISELRAHGRALAEEIADPLLILHAYHAWGEQALDHLMGDFAFVLWDAPARRIFCARDQMGLVPLFYTQVGQTVILSNTLNVLRRYPGLSSALNHQSVADFLLFHTYIDTDATIFAHIRRLPPAHKLTLSVHPYQRNDLAIARYWQLPEQVDYLRPGNPQEIVELFRFHFDQAMADRLRTNRAATSLSGGLDSTSIAVTANRLLQGQSTPGELRGATIVYRDLMREEEGPLAQEVAAKSGFTTNFYFPEDDIARSLDPESNFIDPEPEPWSLNFIVTEVRILRQVPAFARLYFLGFGGDPLFAPSRLPWHLALQMGQFRAIARTLRQQWRAARRGNLPLQQYREKKKNEISMDLARQIDLNARFERFHPLVTRHNQQRQMSFSPLWEAFFRASDPGFTRQPVKVLFPFFDIRLVELMLRMPPDSWCRSKFLLREAMRGALPERVRLRPKVTLHDFPEPRYLYPNGASAWMHELAAHPVLAQYVNVPLLQNTLNQPQSMTTVGFRSLTTRLAFAYWLHHLGEPI